ncbi:MAG: uracil-DNA glycosylase [Deltaproteobacteria bacterium]|nr:uracil-DNA glycosylase [Deltaproteobacteria bacterium]
MSAQEELRQIVRQLKTELEWVLRVGVDGTTVQEPTAGAADASRDSAADAVESSALDVAADVADGPAFDVAGDALFEPLGDVAIHSVAPAGLGTLEQCTTLSQIREVLGDCTRCKLHELGRTKIVFGVGNPKADLMFVGEGPGSDEDRVGEPFVGAAGQLLTRIIEQGMKIPRSEVYIANIVKCRPPRNRDPEPDEVEACEPFLRAQIKAINPRIIIALGRYAAQTLLRTSTPITRLRGTWADYFGIPVMPTYHPAYLLRNPSEKRAVWNDVQNVVARLAGV